MAFLVLTLPVKPVLIYRWGLHWKEATLWPFSSNTPGQIGTHLQVRITLKGENPYLHSVYSKNSATILWRFLSITPGQTSAQFTAEWIETLIITSNSHWSRKQVWCTIVSHQEALFPSCNWIPEGSSTNDYRTRGCNLNGFTRRSPIQLLMLAHVAWLQWSMRTGVANMLPRNH